MEGRKTQEHTFINDTGHNQRQYTHSVASSEAGDAISRWENIPTVSFPVYAGVPALKQQLKPAEIPDFSLSGVNVNNAAAPITLAHQPRCE